MSQISRANFLPRLIATASKIQPLRFDQGFKREVFLVASIGLSAFYYVSLLSYSPFDPSTLAASFPQTSPTNLAGSFGAELSGLAIFWLGMTSYLLPMPIMICGLLVYACAAKPITWSRLTGWAIALASCACIAAAYLPSIRMHGIELPAGGVIGDITATWLKQTFGSLGSNILVATAAACSILLIGRRSILEPMVARARAQAALWQQRRKTIAPTAAATNPQAEPSVIANIEQPTLVNPVMISPSITTQPTIVSEPKNQVVAPISEESDEAEGDLGDEHDHDYVAPRARTRALAKTNYVAPEASVFKTNTDTLIITAAQKQEFEHTASLLTKTFADFGIHGKIAAIQPGPVVTVFEFEPDAGTKLSKMMGLMDDLALALKVDSIFIYPVRGKRAVGVQVPNNNRETVYLGDVINSEKFRTSTSPLTFAMGKSLSGEPVCADLTTMPHLLTAGATGSGKSVAINTLLCSIIMKASPEDVRMILVDPKMLELSVYEGIPHLLMPVITEPARASLALKWATEEMERRYRVMQTASVRNIAGFNQFWAKASNAQKQELRVAANDDGLGPLPLIMLVIDELADLMMMAPKDVESSIQRLAQKARASGIHLVLATQRPSVDIITGVIKANLPCRAAFQVVSKHDSRTILDQIGADKLLGKGDMLFMRPGGNRLERIQGAFVSDEEVLALVAAAKKSAQVQYDDRVISWIDTEISRQNESKDLGLGEDIFDDDPKWDEAISIAQSQGAISASYLQRQLKIGYNRAARMVEAMESKGMVGKADGAKPRKWLGGGGAVI